MASGISEASPPGPPGRRLVVQPLGQRLAAHLPAGPVLVERVGKSDPRPGLALTGRVGRQVGEVGRQVTVEVAAVELEAIDAVVADQCSERTAQPLHGGGMGGVQHRAVAVPPLPQGRSAVRLPDQEPLRGQVSEGRAVRADERHQPEHHGETEVVQPRHHGGRVGEGGGVERPGAVVRRPPVVDHQHPRREAGVEQALRVGQHPLLRWQVGHLDPGVVLRGADHLQGGRFPGGGEERRRRGPEGIAEAVTGSTVHDPLPDDIDHTVAYLVVERRFGPDETSRTGQQQWRRLVVPEAFVALAGDPGRPAKVAPLMGAERHQLTVGDGSAPPALARHRVQVKALVRKNIGHHDAFRRCSSSNCSG